MAYRIAVDVGGTFTDVVVVDDSGLLHLGKALTTRARIFEGLAAGLSTVAEAVGVELRDLLSASDLMIYATTHATNATLEGKTAKTALLVTEGFPDTLVLREGGKSSAYDFREPYPEPYIPRRLTFEIRERIGAEGSVLTALDRAQAVNQLKKLPAMGVEAIAVSFMWSIANPVHELAIGSLLDEHLPGIPYTLSHKLNPIIREYRRTSSAAIDASLKPLMQKHLAEMEADLRAAGFAGDLLGASSFGGLMHVPDLVEKPLYTVRSGPALAPVAGRHYAKSEAGMDNVIVCDTGGTSFDVALIRDGQIKFTRETWLGAPFTGHMVGLSSVDVRSIGAGGGSIAWIDPGGLLRVGPQSAGADPGPACYGRGGSEATVTDAAVVLGYIDPAYFLGGRMHLDRGAAERTVSKLSAKLGQSVEKTADAIVTIASEHMVQAIREMTIYEGVDPRESIIVAGGGAAGLNIVPIARELGCTKVLVPNTAAGFSACGGHYSDVVLDSSRSLYANTADFPFETVNAALGEINASINSAESALRSRGFSRFNQEFFVEARYPHQVWELEVSIKKPPFESRADLEALVEAFHGTHARVFAVRSPGHDVECLFWKGRLTAMLDGGRGDLKMAAAATSNGDGSSKSKKRRAFFGDLGVIEVPVVLGSRASHGSKIAGPAIIEEPTTTIVVYPNSTATVTPGGHYMIELAI